MMNTRESANDVLAVGHGFDAVDHCRHSVVSLTTVDVRKISVSH